MNEKECQSKNEQKHTGISTRGKNHTQSLFLSKRLHSDTEDIKEWKEKQTNNKMNMPTALRQRQHTTEPKPFIIIIILSAFVLVSPSSVFFSHT